MPAEGQVPNRNWPDMNGGKLQRFIVLWEKMRRNRRGTALWKWSVSVRLNQLLPSGTSRSADR